MVFNFYPNKKLKPPPNELSDGGFLFLQTEKSLQKNQLLPRRGPRKIGAGIVFSAFKRIKSVFQGSMELANPYFKSSLLSLKKPKFSVSYQRLKNYSIFFLALYSLHY
jgi:hypothetical protein